jgi:hypothetical protein
MKNSDLRDQGLGLQVSRTRTSKRSSLLSSSHGCLCARFTMLVFLVPYVSYKTVRAHVGNSGGGLLYPQFCIMVQQLLSKLYSIQLWFSLQSVGENFYISVIQQRILSFDILGQTFVSKAYTGRSQWNTQILSHRAFAMKHPDLITQGVYNETPRSYHTGRVQWNTQILSHGAYKMKHPDLITRGVCNETSRSYHTGRVQWNTQILSHRTCTMKRPDFGNTSKTGKYLQLSCSRSRACYRRSDYRLHFRLPHGPYWTAVTLVM